MHQAALEVGNLRLDSTFEEVGCDDDDDGDDDDDEDDVCAG